MLNIENIESFLTPLFLTFFVKKDLNFFFNNSTKPKSSLPATQKFI